MRSRQQSISKRSPGILDDDGSNSNNDVVHGSPVGSRKLLSRPTASSTTSDGGSGGVDKEAFNARLDQRRKARRQERLRRKQKLHRSLLGSSGFGGIGGGAYRAKHVVLFAIAFCVVLLGWMAGFYWLAQVQLDGSGGDNGGTSIGIGGAMGPMQLLQQAKENRGKLFSQFKSALLRGRGVSRGANTISGGGPGQKMVATVEVNTNEVIDMRVLNQELAFDNPNGGAWTQGWDVKPVELDPHRPLKIFVVPHSHCDPGWIKTFDEYFQTQTKQILSSVIEALRHDSQRKFIWAEISYFEWWWREQNEDTRQAVRDLLLHGQFEFVTGGWVQPDEANTQLYAMEIQLQEGHDFIRETFGAEYIPKFGWSIDPFGYSPTMAYLLKKYGFEGMLIQRVHYAIKKELALHKQLEFMWRQTWDEPKGEFDIFTHVMPFYSYDIPHTCGPDPSVCCQFDFARMDRKVAGYVDNCPWGKQPKEITDHNVDERALLLLDQYRKKANLYRSNVVIAPLGDDFRYRSFQEAELQYDNYQRIFDFINQHVEGVEIQFGTLSEYFAAAMGTFKAPILKGSFFTYSDRNEDYWSGYFTSRIFDKALDRQLERVLYAATSMGATKLELQGPRRALSLFQHHDGVTGTAKDAVVEDYAKRIHTAIKETQDWIVNHLVSSKSTSLAKQIKLMPCWQSTAPRGLSQNLCYDVKDQTSKEKKQVILYNPLDTEQSCGDIVVPGRAESHGTLPCEVPGSLPDSKAGIQFDASTGLMTHPVREEWMVWKVRQGGAYLFFPGTLTSYNELNIDIEDGGYVVATKDWKRTVVERQLPSGSSGTATIIDFVYETNLKNGNEEWFVRFTAEGLDNQGVFHTDLNGYNFDTHHFRSDMPIQSQVFPMPTHASIQDEKSRLTILSEHAQGTASLEKGSIDIWLDRRLMQDDDRGLGQRLTDNVPTRTRLRVVVETDGYDPDSPEFEITPFCKQQWKELNHPLEMFGAGDPTSLSRLELDNKVVMRNDADKAGSYVIPIVFMVYKRYDYLKEAIESLQRSDYPRDSLPIIISHDGHVKEMVDYVESIKSDFLVIQLFHPYSCSEHPSTFPGDDPKLNEDYPGDTYGNKREGKVTCAKHHFTWMMNEVFDLEETKNADGFFFTEEDYLVAPTIYETIQTGFQYIDQPVKGRRDRYFGLTFDPTEGYSFNPPAGAADGWIEKKFVTGPVSFRRDMYERIRNNAKDYCTWDDYNWDWSIVHLMAVDIEALPFRILVPGTQQVAHIGVDGGLHEKNNKKKAWLMEKRKDLFAFHGKVGTPWDKFQDQRTSQKKGFGGWGHPVDQNHCLQLFGSAGESVKK